MPPEGPPWATVPSRDSGAVLLHISPDGTRCEHKLHKAVHTIGRGKADIHVNQKAVSRLQ